jgi:exodeoxyribonuclease VII large subunit
MPERRNVRTVSQLTMHIKSLLEGNLGSQWVSGEISNCRPARSGHVYLTLHDDHSQIAVVVWRSTAERLGFALKDGMEVLMAANVEVYGARGSYQLVATRIIPQGVGSLQLALQQLKEKLAGEGLFDPARKRPIPRIPKRIALITSHQGAAVKDMLQVLTRRWPGVRVIIVPVSVQGAVAAPQISRALSKVHTISDVDVVITGRGGGSLEDLWAFNEEIVARAIANCRVPVISAVGHEIDVTIADMVADRRALTPSEAAELAVPDRAEFLNDLKTLQLRLVNGLKRRAQTARLRLDSLATRPVLTNPAQRVRQLTEQIDDLDVRLHTSLKRRVETAGQQLARFAESLNALSPLNVLARGYSATYKLGDEGQRELLQAADQVRPDDKIVTRLATGEIVSRVEPN